MSVIISLKDAHITSSAEYLTLSTCHLNNPACLLSAQITAFLSSVMFGLAQDLKLQAGGRQ